MHGVKQALVMLLLITLAEAFYSPFLIAHHMTVVILLFSNGRGTEMLLAPPPIRVELLVRIRIALCLPIIRKSRPEFHIAIGHAHPSVPAVAPTHALNRLILKIRVKQLSVGKLFKECPDDS